MKAEEYQESGFLSSIGKPKGKHILSQGYNLLVTAARLVFFYPFFFFHFYSFQFFGVLLPHIWQIPIFPDPSPVHSPFLKVLTVVSWCNV